MEWKDIKESFLKAVRMILTAYKNFAKWLGIVVLPEEDEWHYPEETTGPNPKDPIVNA